MTLTALAKLAHVSLSTASKAFSMSDDINAETRDMIFEIAKQNGCFRTFFKAKYPKLMVGIICYEVKSKYYSTIIEAIKAELEKKNCDSCLLVTDFDDKQNLDGMQYFEKYTTVDAIIIIGNLPDEKLKHEIPVVCFNHKVCENAVLTVNLNLNCAIRDIFNLAKEKGIKNIGFISENYTEGKLDLFKKYHEEVLCAPTSCNFVSVNERFEEGGYLGMRELLSKFNPELVICAYDNMALGAMRYAHEVGITVPDKMQIIGIDNINEDNYSIPSLSSVGVDKRKLASEIVDSLFNIIMDIDTPKLISLDEEYYERESSKLK